MLTVGQINFRNKIPIILGEIQLNVILSRNTNKMFKIRKSSCRTRSRITRQTQIFRYGQSIFGYHIRPKQFRFLWFMSSLGVRSPCLKACYLHRYCTVQYWCSVPKAKHDQVFSAALLNGRKIQISLQLLPDPDLTWKVASTVHWTLLSSFFNFTK